MNNKMPGHLRVAYVARMERSGIRGISLDHDTEFQDYAPLQAGYGPRSSGPGALGRAMSMG